MRYLFSILARTALALAVCFPVHAAGEIHYIGFNKFIDGQEKSSSELFDNYVRKLRPIMARFDMHLETYSVAHGGSDDLNADIVTFGSAPDQESFQAFFADAEFQEAFPMLVSALGEHQVVFTTQPYSAAAIGDSNILLALDWVDSEANDALAQLAQIADKRDAANKAYGVTLETQSAGVMSSRGLTDDIAPTEPPQLIKLWSMQEPHGFFDDVRVKAADSEAKLLVQRSEWFWLEPYEIR